MLLRVLRFVSFAIVVALGPQLAVAQGQGVPRPAPVETAPLAPPGGAPQTPAPAPPPRAPPSGGITLSQGAPQAGAPGAAPSPGSTTAGRPTLVPTPGDPLD